MKTKPQIIVQLIHIEGPYKGQIQEFSDPEILIGRHPSCQLRFPVDHAIISRKHAKIVRDGNRFKFIDQSTNGTFLNGKKTKEALLKDGDVLIFAQGGPKVSFLTQVTDQAVEAEPQPVLETGGKALNSQKTETMKPADRKKTAAANKPPAPKNVPAPAPPPIEHEAPPLVQDIRPQKVKVPLSVVFGPNLLAFKELPIVIGKSADCDFPMQHPQIFDHHAQIFFHEDQYWVKDLTGKRLVVVDGSPVGTNGPMTANCEVKLTPKGPFFKFLGQGRLIEIETTPPPEEQRDDDRALTQEPAPPEPKKKSLIGKLWRK